MDRLGFLDIGARGGIVPRVEALRDSLQQVLVEPDAEEAARLAATAGSDTIVLPIALGHLDGDIDFHVNANPFCSSALRANQGFLEPYGIACAFAHVATLKIKCARYDTLFALGGLPKPSVVKIDTQGFEYNILVGLGMLLHDCLAIELEAHFYPLYQGQKLITDLVAYVAHFDMKLRRLANPRSPDLRGDLHFEQDLVEVDAYFTKSRSWLARQDESTRNDFELACKVLDIDPY